MNLPKAVTTLAVLALFASFSPPSVFASDNESDRQKKEDAQPEAKVPLQKAAKIALKSFKIRSGELETEHGRLIWSFDIAVAKSTDIVEVQVDAKTGKIVAVEIEGAKKEAKAEKEGKGKKALTKREKEEDGKKVKKAEKEDEDEEREGKNADSGHRKSEKQDKD